MDTALRNRLTGAVILVLLAVLLLPELLTGSGRRPGKPAVAPAAAADGSAPVQTLQIDLTDAARGPAGAAPAAAQPAAGVQLPVPPPAAVQLPVPQAPAVASSAAAVPPVAAAPAVAAPPPAAAPAVAAERAPAPASAPPAKAAALDPSVPKAPPPAEPTGGDRYFVQVGTFSKRESAELSQKELTRRGFQVSINETGSAERRFFRVRVGPVGDRAAAAALEVRLRPLAPDRAIVAVPAGPG